MKLKAVADRIDRKASEATGENYGAFIEVLIALIPAFLPLLQNCKKPPQPAPPNPAQNPTPEQQKAYEDGWILKTKAIEAYDEESADYSRHALNVMAKNIMREKRKNGEKIKRDEGLELARAALDEAREQPVSELADMILEARAGS